MARQQAVDDDPSMPELIDGHSSSDDDDPPARMPPFNSVPSPLPPGFPGLPPGIPSQYRTAVVQAMLQAHVLGETDAKDKEKVAKAAASRSIAEQQKRLTEKSQRLADSNAQMRKDLDEYKRELQQHRQTIERHQPVVNQLKASLSGKDKKISKCVKEVTEAEAGVARAIQEKRQVEVALQHATEGARRDVASMQKTLDDVQHELSCKTRQCDLLQESERTLTGELSRVNTRLHELDSLDLIRQELGRQRRECNVLKESERTLTEELGRVNARLVEVSSTQSLATHLFPRVTPHAHSTNEVRAQTVELMIGPVKECAVCMDDDIQAVILLPCLHKEFCFSCIESIMNQNKSPLCPLCQGEIKDVIRVEHAFS